MKCSILQLVACTFFVSSVYAQDPHFTQFYANPVYLNPALAGTRLCPRVQTNYRNQWPGLSGDFVTYSISADANAEAISGGVGIMALQDAQANGIIRTTYLSAIYNYAFELNRFSTVRTGFKATWMHSNLDFNRLSFGDQIDPAYGFILPTHEINLGDVVSAPDFSTGIFAYSKRYYAGLAIDHLTRPQTGFWNDPGEYLPRKLTLHAGASFPIKAQAREGVISPNLLYMQQREFQEINFGLYAGKGAVTGGLWYRFSPGNNPDAFILLFGLQSDVFTIGYSYDITISKLNNATYGSHELSFAILFDCPPRKPKHRLPGCPSF
ncbi:MAG: type IX secretion system membrane protein PorP/SprF [Flavobacteriales bacterium]